MGFDNLAECQPAHFELAAEQPPEIEFATADGVFIKQIFLAKAGTYVPQHAHVYDHTSMLAVGSLRVWADGKLIGDIIAPKPIFIPAGVKHTFMSLEDNALIYCIHNFTHPDAVAVLEKHELVGEAA